MAAILSWFQCVKSEIISMGSGEGLAHNRWHAMTWANDDMVPGLNVFV